MKDIILKEYIDNRRNYITNIDPDGLFTFCLINHFYEGKLVGFTNSKDCVYLLDGLEHSANTVTYIDMYVTNPLVNSIDQHIISRHSIETKELQGLKTKLNPNLLFNQDLSDYRHKFPLSTFLFILLLIGEENNIEIDWHKKINGTDLELGHFLIDIDGVISNLSDYNSNVSAWMNKLKEECSNKALIGSLYDYMNQLPLLDLKPLSEKVRQYLKDNFNAETKDGGYNTINDENVQYIEKFIDFINNILFNETTNTKININNISIWKGDRKITESASFIAKNSFSYAIVRANNSNISYTTKLIKIL